MGDDADVVALVERTHVLLQDGSRRALARTGLTPTQVTALALLAEAPRGGMSVTAIAQRLLCTRGNASRLVTRLVATGLVTTGGTETDERLLLVRLTPNGRARLHAAREALAAADGSRLAGLSPEERAQLVALLGALADGAERALKTP